MKSAEFVCLWYACICRNTLKHNSEVGGLDQVILRVKSSMAAHPSVPVAMGNTGKKCARDVQSACVIPDSHAEGLPVGPWEDKTDLKLARDL